MLPLVMTEPTVPDHLRLGRVQIPTLYSDGFSHTDKYNYKDLVVHYVFYGFSNNYVLQSLQAIFSHNVRITSS